MTRVDSRLTGVVFTPEGNPASLPLRWLEDRLYDERHGIHAAEPLVTVPDNNSECGSAYGLPSLDGCSGPPSEGWEPLSDLESNGDVDSLLVQAPTVTDRDMRDVQVPPRRRVSRKRPLEL